MFRRPSVPAQPRVSRRWPTPGGAAERARIEKDAQRTTKERWAWSELLRKVGASLNGAQGKRFGGRAGELACPLLLHFSIAQKCWDRLQFAFGDGVGAFVRS